MSIRSIDDFSPLLNSLGKNLENGFCVCPSNTGIGDTNTVF